MSEKAVATCRYCVLRVCITLTAQICWQIEAHIESEESCHLWNQCVSRHTHWSTELKHVTNKTKSTGWIFTNIEIVTEESALSQLNVIWENKCHRIGSLNRADNTLRISSELFIFHILTNLDLNAGSNWKYHPWFMSPLNTLEWFSCWILSSFHGNCLCSKFGFNPISNTKTFKTEQ